jgi:Caspase domain
VAGNVYALLAGVNDYQGRLNSLAGCVNDVRGFHQFLNGRVAEERRHVRPLLDGDATRENIIRGFTGHLSGAGPDDVAIFYFSGHGSQEPVEERYWHLEPTGYNQTIVCADSRRAGIPDLADKELNELIGAVSASGSHVLVVLDCCHSGGGTRNANELPPDVRARFAPANELPRAPESYLPGVQQAMAAEYRDAGSPNQLATSGMPPRHVALSACESTQLSLELPIGDEHRGVFSAMLQRALASLAHGATYRDLLGAASVAVRDRVFNQHPVGYAALPGDLDQPLFGGAVQMRHSGVALEHYQGTWWIDAGTVHGIQPPQDDDTTVLAVLPRQQEPDTAAPNREQPLGRVRVSDVEPTRSRVNLDDGWQADIGLRYRTVIIDVPLPTATVELRGEPDGVALVRAGLAGSPHIREGADASGASGDRFVVIAEAGELTIARADAWPLAAPVPATYAGAGTVIARLEHLTRWHLIRRLDNPVSTISGLVTIHVVAAQRGERPPHFGQREPIAPATDGHIHLSYRETPAGWQPPYIFVYLHNHSDRDLYCTLLDLTDRFRCHSRLFPVDLIPAGKPAAAYEGRPIDVSVPNERLEAVGAEVFDWLKLIAAEQRFAVDAYDLPNLDGVFQPRASTRGRGPRTVLDRLAERAVTRDAGAEPTEASEWTTALVTLHTHGPSN